MFPKRLLAFPLLFALALMGAGEARAQWVKTSFSGNQNSVYCLVATDSFLFAGTALGVFRTADGSSWSKMIHGLQSPDYIHDLVVNGRNLYSASDGGGIAISTDNGLNWSQGANGSSEVYAVAVDGSNIFAGFVGITPGIYLSTDNGTTWNASWNPVDSGISNGWVEALTWSGSNLFMGTFDGGILYSSDLGSSWSAADSGLSRQHGGYLIYAILAVGSNNTQMLFAGTGGGVFVSTNNGVSWTAANNGFQSNPDIRSLCQVGVNILAGTESGTVFLSSANGGDWTNVSSGLEGSAVNALCVYGADLFAGTETDGVWRRPLSDFGISSVAQTPAAASSEIQVYPNPSSGSTTVSFTAPASGYAEVSIVNMLGEEVARLYTGELAAGEHSFEWGNPGVANGMYECLVRMNGRVESAGIIVMR